MIRALAPDTRGATVVEFALILPVFLTMLLGIFELGLAQYIRSVFEGAMQQAGRISSLQSAQAGQTAIDDYVRNQIVAIVPGATVSFTRKNYSTFSDVAKPEDFTDTNLNGRRDAGECFTDANGNGAWDADLGKTGLGSANDAVLYTATLSYNSFLPVSAFGFTPVRQMVASTTLRNQPFSSQSARALVQICL